MQTHINYVYSLTSKKKIYIKIDTPTETTKLIIQKRNIAFLVFICADLHFLVIKFSCVLSCHQELKSLQSQGSSLCKYEWWRQTRVQDAGSSYLVMQVVLYRNRVPYHTTREGNQIEFLSGFPVLVFLFARMYIQYF